MTNRNTKLGIAALTLSGIAGLWSVYENKPKDVTQATPILSESVNDKKLSHSVPGEASNLIARQTAPKISLRSSDPLTYKSTSEYEAASRYGALPSHMTDIAIEQFSLDSQGQLIVNVNIKHIIEYFLMAAHIEGQEQAISRIKEYIELSLSGDAAQQALEITDRYLRYKEALNPEQFAMSTDFTQQDNLKLLRNALDDKKQTRREYLGEVTSEALFGHEERYDDYSFQRLQINSDTSLNEQEKDQLMAQAESLLPNKMAQDMRYKREEQKLTSQINELRKQPESTAEIHQLRVNFYGKKIANRMAFLESNTPEWQARVAEFKQYQQDILQSNDLDDEAKNLAIRETKQNMFSRKEQVKLAVQSIRGSVASL